jgi:anti-sigma B factor antagonist
MSNNLSTSVREASANTSIIEIIGQVTASAENKLMDAYTTASKPETRAIILDFSRLDYLNSSGIGLLVTMLIRTQRQKQTLLACGLTDHYVEIFQLTRLNEAIGIFNTLDDALASLN